MSETTSTSASTGASAGASTRDLRDYLRILSLRKWTALFVFLLVVAGVMSLSYRQDAVYESKLRLIVPEVPIAPGVATSRTINLETEANLAASPLVAQRVVSLMREAGVEDPALAWVNGANPETLAHTIDVAPVKGTTILLFRAENHDPQRAAQLAHYFALGYLDRHLGQVLAPYTTEKQRLTSLLGQIKIELGNLPAPGPDEPAEVGQRRDQLNAEKFADEQSLAQVAQAIETIRSANSESAIIEDSQVPTKPARPDHVRDGIIAAIVGLVLGFGAAFLRDYVDDSLRGAEDVERQAGATLIGVIPHVAIPADGAKRRGRDGEREYLVAEDDPKAPATEAYRTLRTNLMFMSATGPLRRLLITSPLQGEGKSTIAANLAAVMAQAGQRVLLVGADLRRPSVHRFFGLSNRSGLSSVLSGQAELTEAVQDPGVRGMRILAGGPIPPNPAELLGSSAMIEFLEKASAVTDWIILDGPPVLGLADALVLSSFTDGVLMIVNEATNRRVLAHARDQLAKVRSRSAGAVLNNFGPAFSYYYSDYYAYSSEYYMAQEELEQRAAKSGGKESGGKESRKDRKRRLRADAEAPVRADLTGNGSPTRESARPPEPGNESAPKSPDEFFLSS